MVLEGQSDVLDMKTTFRQNDSNNHQASYKQTGEFNQKLTGELNQKMTGTFGGKGNNTYGMENDYLNMKKNYNEKISNYDINQSDNNEEETESSQSKENDFEEVEYESKEDSDKKYEQDSDDNSFPQVHYKTYNDIIHNESRNKKDPNLLTFNEKTSNNIEQIKIQPMAIGKKKTAQNFYDPSKYEDYEKVPDKSNYTKDSNLTSTSLNQQNKTSQVTSITKITNKESNSLRASKNPGIIIESINIGSNMDNNVTPLNKSANNTNTNLLGNRKSSKKSFTKSATTPKNVEIDSGLLSTSQKNSVVLKESMGDSYTNIKRDKSTEYSKSSEVVNNQNKKEFPSLKKEFNPYEKFKSDNLSTLTNKEVSRLLDKLRKNIKENFKMKKMRELKVILLNGYPLLVGCLPKLFNTDLYKAVIKDIVDTFSYWNICNEAICLLVRELINLFFEYPKDLMLLEDVVDIFIQIPFKAELFKQITHQVDIAEVPT